MYSTNSGVGGDSTAAEDNSVQSAEAQPVLESVNWRELSQKSQEGYAAICAYRREHGSEGVLPSEYRESVGDMLSAWKHSKDMAFYSYHNPQASDSYLIEDAWDSAFMDQHANLRIVLNPDFLARYLSFDSEAGKDMRGLPYLQSLLEDPSFGQRGVIAEYLTYTIWLANRYSVLSATGLAGEEAPGHKIAERELSEAKEKIFPVLSRACEVLAQNRDAATLRTVLEQLWAVNEQLLADGVLLSQALSHEARVSFLIQYINVFGFVQAVDVLSAGIKDAETVSGNEEYVTNLRLVYNLIEGEDVERVMDRLERVYSEVDFSRYALNRAELTASEVSIVESAVEAYCKKTGREPKEVRIFDDGAGTGRHYLELLRRGYTQVIALDAQQEHVEQMEDRAWEILAQNGSDEAPLVVRGDWHALPFENSFDIEMGRIENAVVEPPEVFYCLGRSVHHNRTPLQMLSWMDELYRVTSHDAVGVVDIADIDWGVYDENVKGFESNLARLGLDPIRAHVIFDGPDNAHKFNRMVLTDSQFREFCALTGFRVISSQRTELGEEGAVGNIYYTLEKDDNFDPAQISAERLRTFAAELGLMDPGTNYDTFVHAWGMTLGQALLYGMDREDIRRANARGRGPKVIPDVAGRTVFLEGVY